MENPATWNRATRVIYDAIGEHSRQVLAGVFGHSCARIVHDALEREGLLASEVKPEKKTECICEGEFPEHCSPECDVFIITQEPITRAMPYGRTEDNDE